MKKMLFIVAILLCQILAAQEFGIVNISVCNLRATPDYDAEMVSQALLGTPVHILEISSKNDWPRVMTPDTYTGWVHKDGITLMSKEEYSAWNEEKKIVVTALFSTIHTQPSVHSGTVSDAVAGDRLKYSGLTRGFWKVSFPDGRVGYISKKDAERESSWRKKLRTDADSIISSALKMNGFPYIWAGMSPKGMDCSGFVRTVLFLHDIIIPRDASQQAPKGERIIGTADLQKGDLVFFGRKDTLKTRVSHVGIYLGGGRFIHSLGRVKIASFDPSAPDYDAYNAGRYLFASRILPYIDKQEGLNTTATNPYYHE